MVVVIVILSVAAVVLGAWAASTAVEMRTGAKRSMRAIDNYGTVDVRDQEMLESFTDRVVAPAGARVLGFARDLTPVGYADKVKRKLVHAGSPPSYDFDRFMIWKVIGAASGIGWIPLGLLVLSGVPLLMIVFVGVSWALSFFGPDLVLDSKISSRRHDIERALPDTLDLLTISVEAGLGFEQALDRTAETVPGPLSDELRRMLHETRMGASRADALRALDERANVEELSVFIVAMLQADTFGVSVAKILKSQADEIRLRRRQTVQERAQKLPVKMLAPLILCIFPATLIVLLVPAMLSILDSLS